MAERSGGHRAQRLAHQIHRVLAEALLTASPSEAALQRVMVTHVSMAKDGKTALVYYRCADPAQREALELVVQKNKGMLRTAVAKNCKMRAVPALRWIWDDQVEQSNKIEALLNELGAANSLETNASDGDQDAD